MTLPTAALGAPETKFVQLGQQIGLKDENRIVGYASLFGSADQGGDVVEAGAYAASLARLKEAGRGVKMLWQHDPSQPMEVQAGREALALLKAGAIDGLSIGYRTIQASKTTGGGRALKEIDLWEVSLVTFPMLPEARVHKASSDDDAALAQALADVFSSASTMLARE